MDLMLQLFDKKSSIRRLTGTFVHQKMEDSYRSHIRAVILRNRFGHTGCGLLIAILMLSFDSTLFPNLFNSSWPFYAGAIVISIMRVRALFRRRRFVTFIHELRNQILLARVVQHPNLVKLSEATTLLVWGNCMIWASGYLSIADDSVALHVGLYCLYVSLPPSSLNWLCTQALSILIVLTTLVVSSYYPAMKM